MLEDLNRELEEVKGKLSYQKEYSQLNQKRIKLQGQNADQKGKEEAQRELEKEKIDEEYQRSLLEIEIANINKQIAEVQEQIENCTLYAEEDGYVSIPAFFQYKIQFQIIPKHHRLSGKLKFWTNSHTISFCCFFFHISHL